MFALSMNTSQFLVLHQFVGRGHHGHVVGADREMLEQHITMGHLALLGNLSA